jgi:DNA-binding response OmpR family regulator
MELDPKLIQALSPLLQRVLVVDPDPHSNRLLQDVMRTLRGGKFYTAGTTHAGLSLAETVNPQLIFVEFSGPDLDGLKFTRRLRRSSFGFRKAPVVMMTSQVTPATINGARDSGVHEFLRKPFTNRDLLRRIQAALIPRGWTEAVEYVGPDRRRFNSAAHSGPRKRHGDKVADPLQVRLISALKIVAAALPALQTDPAQAVRSLIAQAEELHKVGQETGNKKLADSAFALHTRLLDAQKTGKITWQELDRYVVPLIGMLPRGKGAQEAAA